MDNKFPGKDISDSDLKDKFPLSSSLNKKKIIKINDDISFVVVIGSNGFIGSGVVKKLKREKLKGGPLGFGRFGTVPFRTDEGVARKIL